MRIGDYLLRVRLAPAAFLIGFVGTFAAISLLGHVVASRVYFENFHRIHRFINPEALFYPTASELLTLAKVRSSPDQVLVVIGGSSVFQGAGQGVDELWSDELARQLGPEYSVLNYALPAGAPTEHGAVAAQALSRLGYKVVYVADTRSAFLGAPDGVLNRYIYWDAYSKGLLDDVPGRQERILADAALSKNDDLGELQWRSRLDALLYFTDLWSDVGYEDFFTTWNYLMDPSLGPFTEPRRLVPDPIPHLLDLPPVDQRIPAAAMDGEMRIMRSFVQLTCKQQANGTWQEDAGAETWSDFDADIHADFGEPFRSRMLVVIPYYDPALVNQLSDSERACYVRSMDLTAERLQAVGYHATVLGASYPVEDYADRSHLTGDGGKKIAADVAPLVRQIAQQLGYTR